LNRKLIAAGLLVCASVASAAPAQKPAKELPFGTRLEQTSSVLQVDADGLHGAGAAVIADAVTKARYVLIGEDHLSREIPLFATSICRLMAPGGLHAFAVEVGPEATRVVNRNLRRPDRVERIGAFMQAHPDAMAFQNGRDESDMAGTCRRVRRASRDGSCSRWTRTDYGRLASPSTCVPPTRSYTS
jgi:hypothetical protein